MATTMSKYGASINRPLCEIAGLSTDNKPIDKVEDVYIQNGSKFIEMDTDKEYLFDGENKEWNLAASGGGGGGGGSTSFTREYMMVSSKIPNNARMPSGTPYSSPLLILDSQSGEYDISDFGGGNVYLVSPLVKLTGAKANTGAFLGVTFTPAENFDGFYDRNNQKYTLRGDSISAGDGKRYFIDLEESTNPNPNIIKYNVNYEFEIE